jgi:hypothetical protein
MVVVLPTQCHCCAQNTNATLLQVRYYGHDVCEVDWAADDAPADSALAEGSAAQQADAGSFPHTPSGHSHSGSTNSNASSLGPVNGAQGHANSGHGSSSARGDASACQPRDSQPLGRTSHSDDVAAVDEALHASTGTTFTIADMPPLDDPRRIAVDAAAGQRGLVVIHNPLYDPAVSGYGRKIIDENLDVMAYPYVDPLHSSLDNPFVQTDVRPPPWAATNRTTGRVEGHIKDSKHTQVGGW